MRCVSFIRTLQEQRKFGGGCGLDFFFFFSKIVEDMVFASNSIESEDI